MLQLKTKIYFMKRILFLFLPFSLIPPRIDGNNINQPEIYASPNSIKWGATGHRVVGEIASSYLTCKAKKNIRKILGTESIAISSNWADFVKSDSTMNYLNNWHYINIKSSMN